MIFKMLYILHVIFQILLEVGEIDEEVYDIWLYECLWVRKVGEFDDCTS